MDASLLIQHFQYAIPVGIVLVCAALVFGFGFKNAEQPPFAQLSAVSDVDRKQANKRRSKTKEKRATSNQVVTEKASPVKKASPAKAEMVKKIVSKNDEVDGGKLKERKQEENTPAVAKKDKSQKATKAGKENKIEQVKNKKNLKNLILEKPVDFDDGDWEQAYSRKDKKKKKEEETPKKTRKSKKTDLINDIAKDQDKSEIKDKVAKETENKELKEKNQKDIILEPINNNVENKSEIIESEPNADVKKIDKVEKVEKEEKKSAKSKKAKKSNDTENTPVQSATRNEKKSADKVSEKKIDENVIKKKTEIIHETPKVEVETEKSTAPVFDELGDVWTEAKPQKKSKKKARKDN